MHETTLLFKQWLFFLIAHPGKQNYHDTMASETEKGAEDA